MADFVEFVGIDVGKAELVVHFHRSGVGARFANGPAGIAALLVRLGELDGLDGPVAVVFEATGGLEHALWRTLAGAGLDARQLCPRRVRRFAQARGRLHKTDPSDARTLAEYAAHFPGEGRAWPGAAISRLGALVLRRRALVEARKAVLTRLPRTGIAELRRLDLQLRRLLDAQIAALEALIVRTIAAEDELAARAALLRSVPGIGPVLTACLLARMPELGHARDGEVAALAGLAPMADDTGERRGCRRIAGGRREVREVLFQAALAAGRYNPVIAPFAARLKAKGKKHKVVVIAAARKLLVLANTVLKRGTPWHPA